MGDPHRPLRLSAVTESFRHSDEGYSAWLDLHTLSTVSDLSEVVSAGLPGLTNSQRRIVLGKVGGNPLLLEEIILFLHRRQQFFESRQTDQPLTAGGLEQLSNEKMDLEKLVDDRFHSLGLEVKQALGWSSEQGLSFLTEITMASAQRVDDSVTEGRLRGALRRADQPASMIQTFGDPGSFTRSEFRQAAFHKVAHDFLHFDATELACVQRAIRDTLTAWLLTDRVSLLPAEEQLDALLMARRTLTPEPSAPEDVRKAWCRGMARLAQLYRDQYLWDQASVVDWKSANVSSSASENLRRVCGMSSSANSRCRRPIRSWRASIYEHLRAARDAMQMLIDRDWATVDQMPWLDNIHTALSQLDDASDVAADSSD